MGWPAPLPVKIVPDTILGRHRDLRRGLALGLRPPTQRFHPEAFSLLRGLALAETARLREVGIGVASFCGDTGDGGTNGFPHLS